MLALRLEEVCYQSEDVGSQSVEHAKSGVERCVDMGDIEESLPGVCRIPR